MAAAVTGQVPQEADYEMEFVYRRFIQDLSGDQPLREMKEVG